MPYLLYQRRHFSHCRRCGFRRNGHCLKLLHTHAGASESCIIGATINQRNRLSAYRRQFYYHRRLFQPPLYQFQPVTGFRSVRLACLDRNHAVLPGLSAAFPERAGACKTRGGATLYRETERLSIRKEQRLGRGHSRADHNMFIHLAERAFQRGYDESEL